MGPTRARGCASFVQLQTFLEAPHPTARASYTISRPLEEGLWANSLAAKNT